MINLTNSQYDLDTQWLLPIITSYVNLLYPNHFFEPNWQVFIVLQPKHVFRHMKGASGVGDVVISKLDPPCVHLKDCLTC